MGYIKLFEIKKFINQPPLLKTMKLKRNLPIIYVNSSLLWGRFFIPVLALFYIASQVSLQQFSIIMGVFALAILLLEIPSGVIADLLGKKKTLLLSRSLYIIEIFLIAFFNGFWIFLIAKIISGIGVSLSSGTSSALLYDTLKVQNRKNQFKKINGNLVTISNISKAIIFIIGGFLFAINNKLPAIASLPLVSLGFVLTFFLEEPYKSKKKLSFKNSIDHLKESIEYFKKSDFVKYLAFLSFFTAAAISISLSISSAYFEKIMIPLYLIGFLAFIASLTTAFSGKKAHKIEEKLGQKKSIFLIQIFLILGLFLISLMIPYLGFLFYLLIPLTAGFSTVIITDYINSRIHSHHRATMLSINNSFGNLGIFLLFPLMGYLTNIKSIGFSFLIFGVIVTTGYFLIYIYRRSKIRKT